MQIESIRCPSGPVRNILHTHEAPRGWALVLPGAYYASQAPGLYYAGQCLHEAGLETLMIDYRYYLEGRALDGPARTEAAQEAMTAFDHMAGRDAPGRVVLAGKSLGSVLALRLAMERRRGLPTDLILLTPVDRRLAEMAAAVHLEAQPWRGFAVRCGADDLRHDDAWHQVAAHFRDVHVVDLPATDHGLNSSLGVRASLEGLGRLCNGLAAWLEGE